MKQLFTHWHRNLALIAAPLWVIVACNANDEKAFKDGNSEGKPIATLLKGGEGLGGTGDSTPVTEALGATYLVTILSANGTEVCRGEARLQILSNLGIKVPEALITCVSLQINLGGILGGDAAAVGGAGGVANNANNNAGISSDGKVLSIGNIASADFSPPRPFVLGPIIQNPEQYRNFTRETTHDVSYVDKETGQRGQARGTFRINVLMDGDKVLTTYGNKYVGENAFTSALHWTLTSDGFNIPAKYGLTFKKWEWVINTKPIMIPKISITGRLSDFITGQGAGTGDAITGELTINLVVTSYSKN